MKVLYVITKANWGGAQKYVFDLATSLPKETYQVAVAFGQPGRMTDELEAARIKTIPILALQRDVSLGADLKSFFELYRLFKKEKPDVVHLNSSKAAGLGSLAARLAGVPKIIFTAHGWPFWEKRSPLARALIYFVSWFTSIFSTVTICISKYDLSVARKMPFAGHKAAHIYNGIRPDISFGTGEVIRNAFPAGVKITGTVGELNANKNQIELIEEARRRPDLYVAIVGEGELRGYLESKIKEYKLESRVKLFGFMSAREVMKGFDTFALPSIKEGLAYVLLEARAAGLPLVANRVGGIPEILDNPTQDFSLERMVKETIALYSRS